MWCERLSCCELSYAWGCHKQLVLEDNPDIKQTNERRNWYLNSFVCFKDKVFINDSYQTWIWPLLNYKGIWQWLCSQLFPKKKAFIWQFSHVYHVTHPTVNRLNVILYSSPVTFVSSVEWLIVKSAEVWLRVWLQGWSHKCRKLQVVSWCLCHNYDIHLEASLNWIKLRRVNFVTDGTLFNHIRYCYHERTYRRKLSHESYRVNTLIRVGVLLSWKIKNSTRGLQCKVITIYDYVCEVCDRFPLFQMILMCLDFVN